MRALCGDALYPFLPQIADLIRTHLSDIEAIERHQAIAVVNGQEVEAVILYGDYTRDDIRMHIASSSPRWCQRGILRALFDFPFGQLRVGRVTAIIQKSNRKARRFVERIGFRLEGVHPRDGGPTLCSYGMTRASCRWL